MRHGNVRSSSSEKDKEEEVDVKNEETQAEETIEKNDNLKRKCCNTRNSTVRQKTKRGKSSVMDDPRDSWSKEARLNNPILNPFGLRGKTLKMDDPEIVKMRKALGLPSVREPWKLLKEKILDLKKSILPEMSLKMNLEN